MATSFTPKAIHEALEADRWNCDQAAREQSELDPRSMLLTLKGWIANGETERARAFIREYRASQEGK